MGKIENLKKEDDFFEGRVHFDLFNADIGVIIDLNLKNFDFAEKCAVALNNMSEETIEKLCEYSASYCKDVCEETGDGSLKITTNRDILHYIEPGNLLIPVPKDDEVIIHLEMACDWEDEHGLEWLIKNDKILYVGEWCGQNPYKKERSYRSPNNYANLKRPTQKKPPSKIFTLTGHCPDQNEDYTITAYAWIKDGEWKVYGYDCDRNRDCVYCQKIGECPITHQIINEPLL